MQVCLLNKFVPFLFLEFSNRQYHRLNSTVNLTFIKRIGVRFILCLLDLARKLKQIFQYKIIMDSLMTNVRLFKMKIVDDDSWSFYSKFPETMMHILYDCEQVKKVWIQFENWWESHSHVRLNLCYKSIVFGYNIDHPDLLLNLCIILLKKMIFNCRFKHRVPTLAQFEDLVSFNYNLERNIAFANNTMHKFLFKWQNLKSVVQIE